MRCIYIHVHVHVYLSCAHIYQLLTFTTAQLHFTTFLGLPSLSILHRPTHSPSSSLSSIYTQYIIAHEVIQPHNTYIHDTVHPPSYTCTSPFIYMYMYMYIPTPMPTLTVHLYILTSRTYWQLVVVKIRGRYTYTHINYTGS